MRELLERLKKLIREQAELVRTARDVEELCSAASTLTFVEDQILTNEKKAAEQASLGSMVADQAKGG